MAERITNMTGEENMLDSRWKDTERSVTLTNEQWFTLTYYLLITTPYRKGEREALEAMAKETKEDGSPKFRNAANNAAYYAELEEKLEVIRKEIEG